ncbi:unnamed protein product [Amaranthus hypochondriacus]
MLASDVITLGAAIFGLLTSIAGSSACIYNSYRTSRINLSILKVKVHNLEILIEALQQKLNGFDVIKPDPRPWILEARKFLEGVNIPDLENRLNDNICYRYCAVKSIEEKLQELDVLLENVKQIAQQIKIKGSKQPEVSLVGSAREDIQQKIWEIVKNVEATGTVCIHGIAGVGKSALAAMIHNKVLTELVGFESIVWVNVEYGLGLKQVQEELASKLHVDLSGITDNVERAKALRSAVVQLGRFLLVLDSMWQPFSLHDIGIPEPDAGSKLIVISRNFSVCRKITRKIKRKEILEIKPLCEAEAWELFESEVGTNIMHLESETLRIARTVIHNLDGIPLAIKMLAESLCEIHDDYCSRIDAAWREELFALSRSSSILGNKSQELYDCFKGSYENLGEVSMSCFISCGLFPKSYLLKAEELIDYWMWEGLLDELLSLEESTRMGWKALNELKDAHLLKSVDNEGEESLNMLNIVRHVALDAAAKLGHHFFIKSGNSLCEFPLAYSWSSNTERASFVQNQLCALQNSPDCKKLTTLLLQDNPLNLDHHENFFSKIRNLRVLDLSRSSISTLPKSFSGLTNLHALLMRGCTNLKRLPSLSNLKKLLLIDLSNTPLEQVPEGLQNLTNLRRLNLSQTRIEVFPAKVVGKLTLVEELLLIGAENGGYVWGSVEIFPQWPGACVEELVDLKRLAVLQLTFLNPKVFNKYVDKTEENHAFQPRNFKFCVGGIYNGGDLGANSIVVIGDCGIRLPKRTYELHLMMCSQEIFSLKLDGCLRDLTIVDVSNFDALTYLFTLEMLCSLKSLQKICVKRCEKMKSILQPAAEANPSSITIPELRSFILYDLPNLESICHGEVLNCPSLLGFDVWNCKRLKLPKVLLGRNIGILEIKGDKEWLEKVKEDSSSSNSTLKYNETSAPAELSTPSFRLRRPESFVREIHQPSFKSFGFPSVPLLLPINRTDPTGGANSSRTWNRFMFMFKSGQAISQSADGLNVANRNSDAKSEDATTLQAGDDVLNAENKQSLL